jgi:hypothetical protein
MQDIVDPTERPPDTLPEEIPVLEYRGSLLIQLEIRIGILTIVTAVFVYLLLGRGGVPIAVVVGIAIVVSAYIALELAEFREKTDIARLVSTFNRMANQTRQQPGEKFAFTLQELQDLYRKRYEIQRTYELLQQERRKEPRI